MLIRLALDAGQTISAERLCADLWPADGPADSGNALQALVSRLRHAAGPEAVRHRPGGYQLAVPPDQVDAAEFERLVGVARGALAAGDPEHGATVLRGALRLWRGPALADVADLSFAAGPVARLEELRLAATEDRIEADLALGRGAGLAPELEELAAAHPLRERLRGQLMRALYLAGRQGDALNVYQQTRELLADQLGVDPSPGIVRGPPGDPARLLSRGGDPPEPPDRRSAPNAGSASTRLRRASPHPRRWRPTWAPRAPPISPRS